MRTVTGAEAGRSLCSSIKNADTHYQER